MKILTLFLLCLLLTSCSNFVVLPKAPYPYAYHQDNKTEAYWIYHRHWKTDRVR